jgi:hypothetical protein
MKKIILVLTFIFTNLSFAQGIIPLETLENILSNTSFKNCKVEKIERYQDDQENEILRIEVSDEKKKYFGNIGYSKLSEFKAQESNHVSMEFKDIFHVHSYAIFTYAGKRLAQTSLTLNEGRVVSLKLKLRNLDFPKVTVKSVNCN